MSAWCSGSVHIVHIVTDKNILTARYRYRTELVWIFVVPTAHARSVLLLMYMNNSYNYTCTLQETSTVKVWPKIEVYNYSAKE